MRAVFLIDDADGRSMETRKRRSWEWPVRVPSRDFFRDGLRYREGIVTGRAEVGRASLGDDSVDTKTEAMGEAVDEKADQVLIWMLGQELG